MTRRTSKILWAASVALSLLVLAPSGAAQAQAAKRQRGLDFTLGLGVAGCTDSACSSLDPSAHFRLQVLYRIIPYLAAGAHVGFQFLDPDRNADRYVDLGWATLIGGEVRGILPVGPLEAWFGIALGFMRMQIDSENNDPDVVDQDWTNGFGLGFGFGAQYFVHPKVALGLDFWLYKGFFDERCTFQDYGNTQTQTCWNMTDDERAQFGVVFTFGLTATFFLPL